MDRFHSILSRSFLIAATVSALATISAMDGDAAEAGTQLGQTLAGESCHLVAGTNIVCGEEKEVSGMLRTARLPATSANDLAARRAAVLAAAKRLSGGVGAVDDVACSQQWRSPSGGSTMLLFCTL